METQNLASLLYYSLYLAVGVVIEVLDKALIDKEGEHRNDLIFGERQRVEKLLEATGTQTCHIEDALLDIVGRVVVTLAAVDAQVTMAAIIMPGFHQSSPTTCAHGNLSHYRHS